MNSGSLKAWKLTKAILVSPRRRGMKRMGAGRNNSEVERVIGGVCFPDSFQRKEICVVCKSGSKYSNFVLPFQEVF